MAYKITTPLVGGGTRKKEIIDSNQNLTVDEIRTNNISREIIFQGRNVGINAGGVSSQSILPLHINPAPPYYNTTEFFYTAFKTTFPFSSDATLTTRAPYNAYEGTGAAGAASDTHGYRAGGAYYDVQPFPAPGPDFIAEFTVRKFPFANLDATFSTVGNLVGPQYGFAMVGNSSSTTGYASSGRTKTVPFGSPPFGDQPVSDIQKFPFSTDADCTDVGDTTTNKSYSAGQSSTENGYISGGNTYPPYTTVTNVIEKFPFASEGNSADVGDLFQSRRNVAGISSSTHGYSAGGESGPTPASTSVNIIDKFTFASNNNATDVGDLTVAKHDGSGISGFNSGYFFGGAFPPGTTQSSLEKFSFSSDGNSTTVGNADIGAQGGTGIQD